MLALPSLSFTIFTFSFLPQLKSIFFSFNSVLGSLLHSWACKGGVTRASCTDKSPQPWGQCGKTGSSTPSSSHSYLQGVRSRRGSYLTLVTHGGYIICLISLSKPTPLEDVWGQALCQWKPVLRAVPHIPIPLESAEISWTLRSCSAKVFGFNEKLMGKRYKPVKQTN